MNNDTDLFAGALRERLNLEDLHSGLDPYTVLAASRRARRRRAAIASVTATVSLVAVMVGSAPLVDLGHRMASVAQNARLADVEGLAGDLSKPLREAWQARGQLGRVSESSGVILLATASGYSAVALATGEPQWAVDPADWRCNLSNPGFSATTAANAVAGPERVLCENRAEGTIQVRDVATGTVLGSASVDWSKLVANVIDRDVVAAGVDRQGHVVARRWNVETGAIVWNYVGQTLPPGSDQSLEVQASSVTLTTGSETVRLDVESGSELPPSAGSVQSSTELAGGLTGIQEGSETTPMSVRILSADGAELLTAQGVLHIPQVDDGTVPGLVFVQNTQMRGPVRALNARSGREMWSSAEMTPVAIVDGKLVTSLNTGGVSVLDALTGHVLWAQPIDMTDGDMPTPVTDGHQVLTIEGSSDQLSLVARTLTTGAVIWAEPWTRADGTSLYVLPTGTVLALGQDQITALAR